jgi:hypothetical protein
VRKRASSRRDDMTTTTTMTTLSNDDDDANKVSESEAEESAKKKQTTTVFRRRRSRTKKMKASMMKNLESNHHQREEDAGDARGSITRRAGKHRRFEDDEDDEDDGFCAKAKKLVSDSTKRKSSLSSLSMGELKRRAREARGRFVLSEKAIAAGGDQTTKFGYCLMYLNAIEKSVNKLDFGGGFVKGRGQTTATTTTRRRYPWEVFERDEEEEEKKRKTKKQKMEDDQREHNNSKSNREKEERKEEEEDTKTLAPLMETSRTKTKSSTPRKRRAKDANAWEENNEMAIKPIKIRPGRYPGEYCQLCGEHEHMVHVKYASQVLGEGKLVCYECLTNEKKELERKEKELANAKERQKRKERQKNRATRMEMMISSPTTTPTTSNVDLRNNNNNSSSSPPSGTPSANALPHHQSSSPISVAVVVDGETVTLNTIVHGTTAAAAAAAVATTTTTTAIHNAEKIEAIHDVSIACDWCGKDTFRTAGELERHKTKWCIAKADAVIINDSRIQATATTSSENEGEQNSDNIGKTIAAKAIATIIAKTEEGERGERKQPKVHAEKYQEALGREQPGISTLNASDIPRKARPSSPHKDPHVGRRTLPLAEVLRRAKDGHPVARNASSGILPQASV